MVYALTQTQASGPGHNSLSPIAVDGNRCQYRTDIPGDGNVSCRDIYSNVASVARWTLCLSSAVIKRLTAKRWTLVMQFQLANGQREWLLVASNKTFLPEIHQQQFLPLLAPPLPLTGSGQTDAASERGAVRELGITGWLYVRTYVYRYDRLSGCGWLADNVCMYVCSSCTPLVH